MSNWIDEDEAEAEREEMAIAIDTSGPMVIKFLNGGDEVFWSDVENQCVAPSGDVVFFNSQAGALRRLAELQAKYPKQAAEFSVVSADELDKRRGVITARPAVSSPLPYTPKPVATPIVHGGGAAVGPATGLMRALDGSPGPHYEHEFEWNDDDEAIEDEHVLHWDDGEVIRRRHFTSASTPAAGGKGYLTNDEYMAANEGYDIPIAGYVWSDVALLDDDLAGHALAARFGRHAVGDGFEVGVSYRLRLDNGTNVAIHDWRGTVTFDDAEPDVDVYADTGRKWYVSPPSALAAVKSLLA